MYQTSKVLFLYCESPLHAGAGEGGVIDLPIQRESRTNLPKIESSSLKGALRETMRKIVTKDELFAAFGPEKTNDASRGALAFTDARLLRKGHLRLDYLPLGHQQVLEGHQPLPGRNSAHMERNCAIGRQ